MRGQQWWARFTQPNRGNTSAALLPRLLSGRAHALARMLHQPGSLGARAWPQAPAQSQSVHKKPSDLLLYQVLRSTAEALGSAATVAWTLFSKCMQRAGAHPSGPSGAEQRRPAWHWRALRAPVQGERSCLRRLLQSIWRQYTAAVQRLSGSTTPRCLATDAACCSATRAPGCRRSPRQAATAAAAGWR